MKQKEKWNRKTYIYDDLKLKNPFGVHYLYRNMFSALMLKLESADLYLSELS